MIFVQAAGNPNGPSMACFDNLAQTGGQLCVSDALLTEIGDVLTRDELRKRIPSLTPARVGKFLDDVKRVALLVENVPHLFSLPRDPKDEPYIDLAVVAAADFLVTWNERHLTYLMRKDTLEGRDFCRRYPKINIISPVGFLRR